MRNSFMQKLKKEKLFLYFIAILSVIAFWIVDKPQYAMWFGFMIAGYSAIANDSIQTLGVFISSNKDVRWWILWLFIGGVLIITHTSGYFLSGTNDVAFDRLAKIPQPDSFYFLQLASPIILLVITRYKMPVSTSFLLLAAFSSKDTIESMLSKTFLGYVIAFIVAFLVWGVIGYLASKNKILNKPPAAYWRILQWFNTAFLWSTWLMHDTANIAVFLPRKLTVAELVFFVGFLVLVVGYVLYKRGDRIQEIVDEKKDIVDVRSATVIDFVYSIILLFFKEINNIPMSTTWVFLGLLAGREIILAHLMKHPGVYKRSFALVGKDIGMASIGLIISLLIAFLIGWTR